MSTYSWANNRSITRLPEIHAPFEELIGGVRIAERAQGCISAGRIYVMNIQFLWDEAKRLKNLKIHGLDFQDVYSVFEGRTATFEDDRFDYGERRLITVGCLGAVPVLIVHTETDRQIRVISFRQATRREEILLL